MWLILGPALPAELTVNMYPELFVAWSHQGRGD